MMQPINERVKPSVGLSLDPPSMESFRNRAEFCLENLRTCPKAGIYSDDSVETRLLHTNKSHIIIEFVGHPTLFVRRIIRVHRISEGGGSSMWINWEHPGQ